MRALVGATAPIVFHPLPQDDPKQRCPDITKARRILNWEPKVNLEEGLQITYDYFKQKVAAAPRVRVDLIHRARFQSGRPIE